MRFELILFIIVLIEPELSTDISRVLMVEAVGQFRQNNSSREVNRLKAAVRSSSFILRRTSLEIVPPFLRFYNLMVSRVKIFTANEEQGSSRYLACLHCCPKKWMALIMSLSNSMRANELESEELEPPNFKIFSKLFWTRSFWKVASFQLASWHCLYYLQNPLGMFHATEPVPVLSSLAAQW